MYDMDIGELIQMPVGDSKIPWPSADSSEFMDWGLGVNQVPENGHLYLGEGHSPEGVYGVSAEEMPGERIQEGETIEAKGKVFTGILGSIIHPDDQSFLESSIPIQPKAKPAPLRGSTFGIGFFSTPAAEIEGESLNPISQLGLRNILRSPRARGMLRDAGATDADDVEWLQGPEEALDAAEEEIVFLGKKTELKTFTGLVSGDVGPWSVAVHVARVNVESDIVIGAGVQRTPFDDIIAPDDAPDWVRQGQELTGKVFVGEIGGQPVVT